MVNAVTQGLPACKRHQEELRLECSGEAFSFFGQVIWEFWYGKGEGMLSPGEAPKSEPDTTFFEDVSLLTHHPEQSGQCTPRSSQRHCQQGEGSRKCQCVTNAITGECRCGSPETLSSWSGGKVVSPRLHSQLPFVLASNPPHLPYGFCQGCMLARLP